MKIYTGGGDKGQTSLAGGRRVLKNHERVEAYGDLDELNSIIGLLAAQLPENEKDIAGEVRQIQSDLFQIGSSLAWGNSGDFAMEKAGILEKAVDRISSYLPPLKGFILPGGHISAATAHVARTVCRRAERKTVGLVHERGLELSKEILIYMNRLSDYFFVLARYCNYVYNTPETILEK